MRTICVVTGNRADFGLLLPVIRALQAADDVRVQTLVTGAHLEGATGRTVDDIAAAGVEITAEVEMTLASDTPIAVAKSTGLCIISSAEALARLAPDLIVVLGDRYEILAVCLAATFATIPIAHLHGGEATEGAIDEGIRHAITKLAHLHFPATEAYRARLLQLGENPANVHAFGTPAIDNVAALEPLPVAALEERVGLPLSGRRVAVATFHPETLHPERSSAVVEPTLAVLAERTDLVTVFTAANTDVAGRAINAAVGRFVSAYPDRAVLLDTLGTRAYLSLVRLADVVIGNSSSGLIEVPAVGTPTVNVGDRQGGRARGPSVIDAPNDRAAIGRALDRAMGEQHAQLSRTAVSPYGVAGAAARIAEVLRTVDLAPLLIKRFHTPA